MTSRSGSFDLVPAPGSAPPGRGAFASGEEVRWCPGCGDHAVLATVQSVLPQLGVRREDVVVVSGIGCSSRLPYYLGCYGLHTIHGRAPAIATGLALTRPDLMVWVVTGDGDALSIGGNHLVHALRRDVPLTVLLLDNQVYGLTKGQYSPTSPRGTVTGSSPSGSWEAPLDPVALALGAGATFVARSVDSDREHLAGVLRAAAEHPGAALVQVLQRCPVFAPGAFETLRRPDSRERAALYLRSGEPLLHAGGGVRRTADGSLEVCAADDPGVLLWDAAADDPATALTLARWADPLPLGVFRAVRPGDAGRPPARRLPAALPDPPDLDRLLRGRDGWTLPSPVPDSPRRAP